MAVDDLVRIEVETIATLMEHFDYYQLLKVERQASYPEIQSAFFRESRLFHPDRYFGVEDAVFKEQVSTVYKRIAEAYGVLKEPDSRQAYDQQLARGAGLRLDRGALEESNRGPEAPENVAETAQGRKFLALGLVALNKKDFGAAVMNIQFALNAEPKNPAILQHLQVAKQGFEELKKKGNPYKLRIG